MISASIVTFHTDPAILKRLLDSIDNSIIDKVFVIDNSSSSDVSDLLKNYPKSTYIDSGCNLGYGKAHNIGLKASINEGYKYHIIINPDIHWEGDIISPIVYFLDNNEDIGQLMPKILYPNGDIQYLCKLLPNPFDLFIRRFVQIKSLTSKHNAEYEMHWSGYNMTMQVPVLSGCFMVLRNSIIEKTGGFDERFFIYCEDVDLCRRIGQVSKTVFFPSVSVYHSFKRGSYNNKKLLLLHLQSVVKYFNKWGWIFDKDRSRINKDCRDAIKKKLPRSKGPIGNLDDNLLKEEVVVSSYSNIL